MYKSPIEKLYGEIQTQMVQEDEKMVMKVIRKVGIHVEKEELIKALLYDRNQYTKGYEDGANEVLDKVRAEIEQKLNTLGIVSLYNTAINDVLEIIDKYKAGSEG